MTDKTHLKTLPPESKLRREEWSILLFFSGKSGNEGTPGRFYAAEMSGWFRRCVPA
jgi:hypothetical protein